MIVAILATLKAGAAYVPVDVSDPQVRIAQVLHDANAQALLIDSKMLSHVESFDGPVFVLDQQLESLAGYSTDNVAHNATANDLAYVMYTSGSTGVPKGVQITHRGVVRLVKEANYVTLTRSEVVLQMAPLSFDASTFEVWGALLNGARLVLMPEQRPSLDELAHTLEQHQVTTLWLTAGLFRLVVDENVRVLKAVRQLLAGGDALSLKHVRRVREELPACELINGYGPTESTSFACCYPILEGLDHATVPIGRPISNTEVYVLDNDLRPVPIGIPGELYIGGDGLARGYHNLPALTAEKFIPNPFSNKPGARLFKTGDRTRHLAASSIEFLGRKDYQIKLRGFRIELEEIEFHLSSHPAVSTAVVQLDVNSNGEKRLVAAVAQSEGEVVSGEQLRLYLEGRVPAYMIPAVIVTLDHVPLTSNGKIDRRALRELAANNHEVECVYVAPRTEKEQKLADCWATARHSPPLGSQGVASPRVSLFLDEHLRPSRLPCRRRRDLRCLPRKATGFLSVPR
jgi:amino acid adenylation domain-containing protein